MASHFVPNTDITDVNGSNIYLLRVGMSGHFHYNGIVF